MPVSEAQKKAITKYDAKAYDKFLVRVKRGEKAVMEEAARASPEGSLNGYVVNAVKQRMERDKRPGEPLVTPGVQVKAAPYQGTPALTPNLGSVPDGGITKGATPVVATAPDTPIKRDKAYLDDMKARRAAAHQDYLDGMKYKDIAEKHGVSLSAVKSWVVREWKKGAE